jgi:uncharacterized protein (DUF885 family)
MKFRTILQALLGFGLTAHGAAMDERLSAFFKNYLEVHFRLEPMAATQLGDHRFDDQLEAPTKAAREGWEGLERKTLEELPRQIDFRQLSRAGQIDYEIFQHELTRSLWTTDNIRPYERDPRVYSQYISDSVFLLLTQSTLAKETNLANCIARMQQVAGVVTAAKENLRNPPRVYVETAIRQNRGAVGFYEKDLFELAGQTPQLMRLKAAAAQAAACVKAYQGFLERELLPKADGEWRIGRDKFYRKMELDLDAGLTADQVLTDAQAEFDRVQREMYVVARQLWSRYFLKQPLPPDDQAGRRQTIELVLAQIGQDHGTPENLVSDGRKTVADIKSFISDRNILALPEPDTCQVIEMPEFKRGNSTAYMNSPPPLDPHAAGQLAVSPPPHDWDEQRVRSYLEEYNNHMLQILIVHEGYPGHYVQMEYANCNPSLVRRVMPSGVYVEGWAVYTEQMMLDQGYGGGDLRLRLTQLKFYLRAVANAILDHKMHCTGMTEDEAMELLVKGAYQSEGEARLKVIRSKQSSCQLSTYFVGRMAHYRLRQQLERELGNRFSLAGYHETVLKQAAVPVKYLPELVGGDLAVPK